MSEGAAVNKLVEVALRRYAMIEEGDRILVAVSGGKDSTTLACDLAAKRRWWPATYELTAIHIATDFYSCGEKAPSPPFLSRGIFPMSRSMFLSSGGSSQGVQ